MNDSEELNDEAWDAEESDATSLSEASPSDAPEGFDADASSPPPSGTDSDGPEQDRGGRGGGRRREEEIEPKDDRTRQALEFVTDVVDQMEMECRVRLQRPKDGNAEDEICIEIAGRDAGRIIGKKGQVLAALQFLTHRVVNRPGLDKRHVTVDAEGYRSRRDDSLATMAQRLGRQAVEQGKIITFEPMNPRDRRVVHLALAKFEGVVTRSDGEGEERRVQIIPVRRPSASESSSGS